jgi:hypothetical protein
MINSNAAKRTDPAENFAYFYEGLGNLLYKPGYGAMNKSTQEDGKESVGI